ncbi:unnamed protein product [Medioppia subpectinata]|uniref:Lipase domain-containing protein n=1 Tax=Medioppia subpectinata TaxID=1979941 RepID=A0A7R9QGM2_9ACAR|nr:unnamed protein product [Medioppia subpectinata]CAG2120436.1 unnamed protein product [Medioppia subpectinata]
MRDEFLHVSNCNVIFVDWSAGNGGNYDQNVKGLSLSKVHIIGHSLGAHTSGFVGHAFNGQIARITGLDPAGPGFNGMPASDKLNPTNAQFVDAIHSDAVLNTGAGIVENSGHLDFWPDNGKNHPGCTCICMCLVN